MARVVKGLAPREVQFAPPSVAQAAGGAVGLFVGFVMLATGRVAALRTRHGSEVFFVALAGGVVLSLVSIVMFLRLRIGLEITVQIGPVRGIGPPSPHCVAVFGSVRRRTFAPQNDQLSSSCHLDVSLNTFLHLRIVLT